MKIAGISMIRNDADIVEPFVRHTLRHLDHLFVIVHSPEDGTGEILKALHDEGLPMTLVHYGEPAFLQGEGLTWLARQAYAAIRPDFIIALDAAEAATRVGALSGALRRPAHQQDDRRIPRAPRGGSTEIRRAAPRDALASLLR